MSTGKTENLELNQWVLDDPYLMEEVNEDNRKIDAAIAPMALEKIGEIVTTQQCQQIDLDVSELNWERYKSIIIFGDTQRCNESGGPVRHSFVYIKANNLSSGAYANSSLLNGGAKSRTIKCHASSQVICIVGIR